MRLIDADAFREWWLDNGENEYIYDTNSILDSIDSWPTFVVDAVPVVRCGECKNYDGEFRCKCFTFDQEGMPVFMRADDFCSYGERKEAIHD